MYHVLSHLILILTHLEFSACDCGHNEAGGVTNAQSWDVTCRHNELPAGLVVRICVCVRLSGAPSEVTI